MNTLKKFSAISESIFLRIRAPNTHSRVDQYVAGHMAAEKTKGGTMQEWFKARSPGRAAAPIAAVLAGLGSISLALKDWPNLAEVIGDLTVGYLGGLLFYWIVTWLILRIAALFVGKWWEKYGS